MERRSSKEGRRVCFFPSFVGDGKEAVGVGGGGVAEESEAGSGGAAGWDAGIALRERVEVEDCLIKPDCEAEESESCEGGGCVGAAWIEGGACSGDEGGADRGARADAAKDADTAEAREAGKAPTSEAGEVSGGARIFVPRDRKFCAGKGSEGA